MALRVRLFLFAGLLAQACAPNASSEEPSPSAVRTPDLLFADFTDGKLDAFGHPAGAQVFDVQTSCAPEIGQRRLGGVEVEPGRELPGVLCRFTTRQLGRGEHEVNLRHLIDYRPYPRCDFAPCSEPQLVALRAFDETGQVLLDNTAYLGASNVIGEYADQSFAWEQTGASRVSFEVYWPGAVPFRLYYVEVFARRARVLIDPPSGVQPTDALVRLEIAAPPSDEAVRVRCGDEDVTERIQALVSEGVAQRLQTEFRQILTVPSSALPDSCRPPATLRATIDGWGGWDAWTSEVRKLAEPPPCTFAAGLARVLVTGFVPFPAGVGIPNTSEQAITAFDPSRVPEASIMKLILPVEYDSAAAIVRDVVARCSPDVVISFGQGRERIDLETTAYNRKDTAQVPGGVPDNRGRICVAEPIVDGGADELRSLLPIDSIRQALEAQDFAVGLSDDPGRYVCNNLFYSLLADDHPVATAGFVHLPRPEWAPQSAERLGEIVETVVRQTLAQSAN